MLYDDDKKKKKGGSGTVVTESQASANRSNHKAKRKTILSAIGNTDAFQKHLDRKGERIYERKYDNEDYKGYNVDVDKRNKKLMDRGIDSRYKYKGKTRNF